MERSFQYSSNIQEIPRIRKDLEFLKTEWAIPESDNKQILVIIEELFSNIVRYAFADKNEHHVDIRLGLKESQFDIESAMDMRASRNVANKFVYNPLITTGQKTDDK